MIIFKHAETADGKKERKKKPSACNFFIFISSKTNFVLKSPLPPELISKPLFQQFVLPLILHSYKTFSSVLSSISPESLTFTPICCLRNRHHVLAIFTPNNFWRQTNATGRHPVLEELNAWRATRGPSFWRATDAYRWHKQRFRSICHQKGDLQNTVTHRWD